MSILIQANRENEKNRGEESAESGTSYNYSFRTSIHFLIKRPVHNGVQNYFNGAS